MVQGAYPLAEMTSGGLGFAIVLASPTPLLLLDNSFTIRAVSGSFCRSFNLDAVAIVGRTLFEIGRGEWALPVLRDSLEKTLAGSNAVAPCRIEIPSHGGVHHVIVNIQRLTFGPRQENCLLVAIADLTAARLLDEEKDERIRDGQVLLQEMHHRIGNSLQIIASTLMVGLRDVHSDIARQKLQEAHQRVMAIARLQRHLTQSSAEGVSLNIYLHDLCTSISASMIQASSSIQLKVQVDDCCASADHSVAIGLIVTELVINALKYAFPSPGKGREIVVELQSNPEYWDLSVADNGAGKALNSKPGLGTSIIQSLAAQLHTTIVVADNAPGTRVTLHHDGPLQ